MNTSHPYFIIKSPVLTEESTIQTEAHNKYVFKVVPKANKRQIRDAIEQQFNVRVIAVNTMNYTGKKSARRRTGVIGRRASWKKAVVTLHRDDSIDLI